MESWADNTDRTDVMIKSQLEFYTALEIKEVIPDFNIAKGSSTLGILISYGRVYIIYCTNTGDLLWRKETELKFATCARHSLAKPMFGKDEVYLLVMADKVSVVKEIVNRYGQNGCGKIHPNINLPGMIFLLKDPEKDLTLKLITEPDYYINTLESILSEDIEYDERYPFFSGMTKGTSGEYNLHAYMFDLYKVATYVLRVKLQ